MTKKIFYGIILVLIFFVACNIGTPPEELSVYEKTEKNYGKEIAKLSKDYYLNSNYLKALIVLECDGDKQPKERYEKGVYEQLKAVRDSAGLKFENITQETIKGLSDSVLREMSKSYGAFQLMGYKATWLGISLDELKRRSTFWGVVWIDKTYGKYIRNKHFKHAFHIHNAGKLYPDSGPPLTHNPDYVERGLYHMKVFRKRQLARRKHTKPTVKIKPEPVFKKKEERFNN